MRVQKKKMPGKPPRLGSYQEVVMYSGAPRVVLAIVPPVMYHLEVDDATNLIEALGPSEVPVKVMTCALDGEMVEPAKVAAAMVTVLMPVEAGNKIVVSCPACVGSVSVNAPSVVWRSEIP